MSRTLLLIVTVLIACLHGAAASALAADAEPDAVDYNRDIRPILSDKCFFCHGPDDKTREAKLRLDLQEGSRRDLGGYQAIVPGDPEFSEVWVRITSEDKTERMPPAKSGKTLTAEQIELIRKWIAQGGDYAQHWAYVKPVKHAPPVLKGDDWSAGPIDRFILDRLRREKLSPSPDADRVTLIRRLYFDLIGLPPTAAEVDAFVNDSSRDAYEKVVDRLLASPHFGERLAIYWLDLVRFADTVGYHGDQDHNISPYRDYVIKSFNDNKPFDEFTIEQLAGDLLPQPDLWQKIATGYNRLLQTSHEGGVQPGEYLHKYLADRVRNVGEVWLGQTTGCAECHNHKYDPITQADFYSLGAFFADVDEAQHFKVGSNALPTKRPPEIAAWNIEQYQRIQAIEDEIRWTRKASVVKESFEIEVDPEKLDEKIKKLEAQKAAIEKEFRLCMVTQPIEPWEVRVLPRGDWLNKTGPVVRPAIPAFLGRLSTDGRATRLDLARWLVSRDNPLTARVYVNRLWSLYFGAGLCVSVDDFGAQGEAPHHPRLLDWLAVEFMDSGWDVKHVVKLMVMSRAYHQSSLAPTELRRRDPQNKLLARQSRWRLDAELVRDNALAVGGLLNRAIGGHSVKPYQPQGYYQHLNFPQRKYQADMDERQYRRGLYMHWQRQFLHPMLRAFDAPMREECTAKRTRSNTPLAALVLLNDPTFVESARALAVRIMQEGGATRDQRIKWAWKQALSRDPSPQEQAIITRMFIADVKDYRTDPAATKKLLSVGMHRAPKELDEAELAAWTGVARAILNLSETMTRN